MAEYFERQKTLDQVDITKVHVRHLPLYLTKEEIQFIDAWNVKTGQPYKGVQKECADKIKEMRAKKIGRRRKSKD